MTAVTRADVLQNFGIIEALEKEGIVMPFPTQTISLKKNDKDAS